MERYIQEIVFYHENGNVLKKNTFNYCEKIVTVKIVVYKNYNLEIWYICKKIQFSISFNSYKIFYRVKIIKHYNLQYLLLTFILFNSPRVTKLYYLLQNCEMKKNVRHYTQIHFISIIEIKQFNLHANVYVFTFTIVESLQLNW